MKVLPRASGHMHHCAACSPPAIFRPVTAIWQSRRLRSGSVGHLFFTNGGAGFRFVRATRRGLRFEEVEDFANVALGLPIGERMIWPVASKQETSGGTKLSLRQFERGVGVALGSFSKRR